MVADKARRKQKELKSIGGTSYDLPKFSASPPVDGLRSTQFRIRESAACCTALGSTVEDVSPSRRVGIMAQVPSAMPIIRAFVSVAGR